ncbi:MAG: 4-alpha-glucanotransferase [Oscillospiraceae bacterium]|nr:4-alpha-glucanotransferase [Oscillospiraceae bacterium]
MKRSSGILMPISSLPSPHGIGTFGKAAYAFADFLHAAGQTYWQVLPLGPTGYGDSPYQSFSTFAGNPYFIDLDLLVRDKLLTRKEVAACDADGDPARVDYGRLYTTRFALLEQAKARGWERERDKISAFEKENADWLADYALFMALKRKYEMRPWTEWPEEIRLRRPEALERSRTELREDIELFTYIQFLFFRQWRALKEYLEKLGIRVIGDLPIYVAPDSADVWAEPQWFRLDEDNLPTAVAGVPPDYFSVDGQFWGNPIYDYDALRKDGYGWWIRRVAGAAKLFDVIRIDHFRAFASYWSVPAGETTAKNGKWIKGPGLDLVGRLTDWFCDVSFIAEDLGVLSPDVNELLKASGLPGMKVLQFAFDAKTESDYLPHRYDAHCVCYTGTHDNTTLAAWFDEAKPADVKKAIRYLGLNEREGFREGVLRGGMGSAATLFVAQMQDWLGLGGEARMNTPGKPDGNWQWRMLPGAATKRLAKEILEMTKLYGRYEEEEDDAR